MKKYIIIEADINDGDYVTEKTLITDEKLKEIMPVIEAVKKQKEANRWGYNWPQSEHCEESIEELYPQFTEDELDEFRQFVPSGIESDQVHTIESIELLEVTNETKLL